MLVLSDACVHQFQFRVLLACYCCCTSTSWCLRVEPTHSVEGLAKGRAKGSVLSTSTLSCVLCSPLSVYLIYIVVTTNRRTANFKNLKDA